MNSPLQLKNSHLVGITLHRAGETVVPDGQVAAKTALFRRGDAEREFRVHLHVKFGGSREKPTAPVVGEVEMVGEFEVHPDFPADQVERLVWVNGSSILFGSVREIVAGLSGRTEGGSYLLPSISFHAPTEAKLASKANTEAKTSR